MLKRRKIKVDIVGALANVKCRDMGVSDTKRAAPTIVGGTFCGTQTIKWKWNIFISCINFVFIWCLAPMSANVVECRGMSWRAWALQPGRAAWSSFDEDIPIVRFTFFSPRWIPFSHVASRGPRASLRTPPSSTKPSDDQHQRQGGEMSLN